jgi:hypothetical protein
MTLEGLTSAVIDDINALAAKSSITGELKSGIAGERITNAEVLRRLSEYNAAYVDKDIFLRELSWFANQAGVNVTHFSEVTKESNDSETPNEAEAEPGFPPSIAVKAFSVTLYGRNDALNSTLGSVRNLSGTQRITEATLVSDSIINVLPKVPNSSTLLETLADAGLLEAYKLSGIEYSDMSSLSFTIEFFFRIGGETGDAGAQDGGVAER